MFVGNGRTRVSGGAVGGVGSGGWASLSNAAGGFQNSALSGSRNRAGPMDQFLQQ